MTEVTRRTALKVAAGTAVGAAGLSTAAGAASASASADGARRRATAATILRGGLVWTGEHRATTATALAIGHDGEILAVGGDGDVRRHQGRGTEVIDLKGQFVMPGIHDGHMHPLFAGYNNLNPCNLGDASLTVPQLLELLQVCLDDTADEEPDGWLVVQGWNTAGLLPSGTTAHKGMLDALPTPRPIILVGSDGHSSLVNSRALDLAGITAATPDPVGGEIVRDANGDPTGLLKDQASGLVRVVIPPPDPAKLLEEFRKAVLVAASYGVTSWVDATSPGLVLSGYEQLAATGDLPARVWPAVLLSSGLAKDPDRVLAKLENLERRFADVPEVTVSMVKIFMDGVIEYPAQSAAMLDPYLDGNGDPTDNYGFLALRSGVVGRLAAALNPRGFSVHTHAIGDRAVRTALDGFEAARAQSGVTDARNTIAHLQVVHPDDYRRFADLGVLASMQLHWASTNIYTLGSLQPYINPETWQGMYPARSLQQAGAGLAGGSDWPVDPLNPWNQIETAINRLGALSESGPLLPAQGISRHSSMVMHTAGSAFQMRHDDRTGRLTPGRLADLVVVDRDLTAVPVREIRDTQVSMTMLGGRVTYDMESDAGREAKRRAERWAFAAEARRHHAQFEKDPGMGPVELPGRHIACGCERAAHA